MGMTEQLEQIALEVAAEVDDGTGEQMFADTEGWVVEFAKRLIAALPKPDPVGVVKETVGGKYVAGNWVYLPTGSLLYTEAPITTPASEQNPSVSHEDTERLNYLIKTGRIALEVNGEYFTYNHTSGRSGPAMATPRAAIDASMDEKGGA